MAELLLTNARGAWWHESLRPEWPCGIVLRTLHACSTACASERQVAVPAAARHVGWVGRQGVSLGSNSRSLGYPCPVLLSLLFDSQGSAVLGAQAGQHCLGLGVAHGSIRRHGSGESVQVRRRRRKRSHSRNKGRCLVAPRS